MLAAAPGDWGASIRGYETSARRPAAAVARPRTAFRPPALVPRRGVVPQRGVGRRVFTPRLPPAAALNRGVGYDQTAFRDGYNLRKAVDAARSGRAVGSTTFRRYYAPRGIPNGRPD